MDDLLARKTVPGRPADLTDDDLATFRSEFTGGPNDRYAGVLSLRFGSMEMLSLISLANEYEPSRTKPFVNRFSALSRRAWYSEKP